MINELLSEAPWLFPLTQGTACLAAGLAASYVLRHRPARAHRVLLTTLLMAVLMPGLYLTASHFGLGLLASEPALPRSPAPLGSVLSPAEDGWGADAPLPAIDSANEATLPTAEPSEAMPVPSTATVPVPWSLIAMVGWSAVTTLLLLRLVVRFLLGWRVVHAAQLWDAEPMRRALNTAKGGLGVSKAIQIRRSGSVRSPVIWCWSREPVLLVQESASHAEDRADWTGVFCHEVSHWQRLDHVTGLFTEVLMAAFPWHPLLWWAKERLLRLSEQACDDWVLAIGQNDTDYAEMLLGLAAERQMAFLPTTIGKGKTMNLRIRRIITDSGSNPRIGRRWALVVGLLAVGATVSVAVAQPRPAKSDLKDAPPTKVFKEQREIGVRETPEADQQRIAMKRLLEQLTQQAQERKAMLGETRDLSDQERQIQQIELKLLVEQIEQMKSRLETLSSGSKYKPGAKEQGKPGKPEKGAKVDSLRQRHEELAQMIQKTERELGGLKDGQEAEAKELKLRLTKLRAEMADVDQQLGNFKGKKEPAKETPDGKGGLVNVKENPKVGKNKKPDKKPGEPSPANEKKGSPEGSPRLEKEGAKAGKKLGEPLPAAVEKKKGGPESNPRLEAEVDDLRSQMKDLRGQMQQMQKLLEQAGERGQMEKPAKK